MSTTNPYQPSTRLIDNRQELARLYVEQNLTIREIAEDHAEVTKTPVYNALREYGILEEQEDNNENVNREYDPPSDEENNERVSWAEMQ